MPYRASRKSGTILAIAGLISGGAGLTMGAFTYAMRGSKEKITRGSFEAIKSALENYNTDFGEYPEPASTAKMAMILPAIRDAAPRTKNFPSALEPNTMIVWTTLATAT